MAHTHEVVYSLVHWLDDEVFRQYPTWEDCERAGIFTRPLLEKFFGPLDLNKTGTANYAQCAERGIGRKVVAKMLAGTETDDAIRTALENFPMTERRRRYEAAQAEKERQAGIKAAELSVRKLIDYDMLCCMVDENLTQQHIAPKTIFEIVSAAIKKAEKMLRETNNVYEFNAQFKHSRGLPTLTQKSVCLGQDKRNPDWAPEEYTRAKLDIEPSGNGLGRGFIQHFLPAKSVANHNTLQATITACYQERWRQEGDKLLDESQLALWQAKETNDAEKIAAALELEKQAKVLLGKVKEGGISRALLERLDSTAKMSDVVRLVKRKNIPEKYHEELIEKAAGWAADSTTTNQALTLISVKGE